MKGAIVFLVVFAIVVVITLGNTNIPPGKSIYDAFCLTLKLLLAI